MLMKDQIHRAWEDFLVAECTATPVVIVLEDMHWGDLPSIHLFDVALNRLRDHPFLLLALARLEVDQAFPELWATRNVTRIGLGRLSKNASRRLAREMLGAAPSDEAIDRLVDRADGHAFFLEELIRAASRREEAPPETVLAMLQARVAALGAEARLVLRAASIFGHAFFSSGIMALVGSELDRASVHDALQQLSEEELVARRTSMPDEEYVFRHALLREAVYAMLTEEDRATGHRLAARWLERRPDTSSLVLAEHFERGGDRAHAAEHYLRAAEQSLEGNDLASAIALGEKAVACGASGATLGAVRLIQAAAHRWRGNFAASKICGAEAMRCLEPGSARWYRAAAEVGTGEGVLGANDTLVEVAQTLLVTPSCGNVAPARIAALASVVPQLVRIGRVELADLLLEAAASARSELASPEPVAEARFHEARAVRLTYAGDPTAFLDETRRVAELFEEGGDKRGACLARAHHGYGLAAVGAYDAAEAVLRDALAESERLGLTLPASSAKHNLGPVLLRRGAIDEARRVETEAVIEGMKEGNARFESASRIYLAAIEMAAGDLAGAEHEARRAVTLLQPNTPLRGWALATLADVLLASGRLDEALACTEEARNVFRAVGGVGEGEGVVYLVCAKTLHAAGDDETARKAIRQARARLMQRASTIADEEMRARFLEDVPENRATLELAGAWLGK
jgi:tetratricopeptide (TPR) repeat protein